MEKSNKKMKVTFLGKVQSKFYAPLHNIAPLE